MNAIIWKYGYKPGLTTKGGEIINWPYKDIEKPTIAELGAIIEEYEAATAYKERRRMNYPSVEDQLDLIFHGGIESWKSEIQKIKDKYPKPTI